jgi:hypothetical protein
MNLYYIRLYSSLFAKYTDNSSCKLGLQVAHYADFRINECV